MTTATGERWIETHKRAPWITQSTFSGAVRCACGATASFVWPASTEEVNAARARFAERHGRSCGPREGRLL